jgi:hypothetical protein
MVYFTDIMLSDFLNTRFAPIQEALLPLLDPTEIIALMKSSKALHDSLTRTLKTKEHNINAHLSQFFKDPRAFRSIQAAPDAVISGRYVHLDRACWAECGRYPHVPRGGWLQGYRSSLSALSIRGEVV